MVMALACTSARRTFCRLLIVSWPVLDAARNDNVFRRRRFCSKSKSSSRRITGSSVNDSSESSFDSGATDSHGRSTSQNSASSRIRVRCSAIISRWISSSPQRVQCRDVSDVSRVISVTTTDGSSSS
eukprot:Mycagemm_TRINITY_DN9998_c0_g2::TRINITY_DN9998_c0_g2_i1::g.3322::m.3322 type:complete len:127 gc:universal TRINITY_DN9998_c0_g2_i1:124-504(+)